MTDAHHTWHPEYTDEEVAQVEMELEYIAGSKEEVEILMGTLAAQSIVLRMRLRKAVDELKREFKRAFLQRGRLR